MLPDEPRHERRWSCPLLLLCLSSGAIAQDESPSWPHFRGPAHDGVSQESEWSSAGAAAPLWKRNVGLGYSSVAIADGRLYTAGHVWLREAEPDLWQVGLTRFAHRMLGEPVEVDLETELDAAVSTGQVVGWLEGFKAVTDLFAPFDGRFAGANPALEEDLEALHRSPYERGWLFALRGTPGDDCVDTEGYASFLEVTIDKMMEGEV